MRPMRQAPELYVPASERGPRRDWLEVVARIYAVCGVVAMALSLYVGLSHMQLGHLKDALWPFIIVTLCWYGFGQLVAWIVRPALPDRGQSR